MVMGCEVEVKVEYVKVEYVPAAGDEVWTGVDRCEGGVD